MTATTTQPERVIKTEDARVTQLSVVRSEWTKFWSLRSTLWTVLVAGVLMIGLGALVSAVTAANFDRMDAGDRASFDPIATSLSGVSFTQLAIGVLGVLLISGEYSTGMIRATLTVVPKRLPVLWAKLAVFSGVVAVFSLVATLAAFLVGQVLLNGQDLGVTLSADGVWSSVFGATGYLTLAGVIGLCLGALLRSTAGAISTFVGVFFVLTPLAALLPTSWTQHFVQYLPAAAGGSMYGSAMPVQDPLSAGQGWLVMAAYAVVMIVLAAVALRRRDA